MWRRILLINWYIIVCVLALIALTLGMLRSYPSLYQSYLPIIQENISSLVDKPVEVEEMRIDWSGITPQITINNLFVYSDEMKTSQLLYVKKALLSLDIYESFLQKKPIINQLILIGSNLEAVRTKNHRIVFNGVDVSERIAKRKQQKINNKVKVSLLESTIAISDELKEYDYFFDHVNIELVFDKDQFKVTSKFILPETLGESFTLIANVVDFDKGLNNIKGNLYTRGEHVNLELIDDFFPQLQVGVSSGVFDFEAWGEIKSESKRLFTGRLDIRDLQYKPVGNSVSFISEEAPITDFSTEFKLFGTKNSWNLALINSEIQAENNVWRGNKYEIGCLDCGSENYFISTAFDYVNLTHLFSTVQHFPKVSAHFQDIFSKIHLGGELSNANFSAYWKNNKIIKYKYESSLQNSTITLPGHEFEITSLNGELSGNHINGNININSSNVNFSAKKLLDYSHKDQTLTGLFEWQILNNNVITTFQDVRLLSEGLDANLQGLVKFSDESIYFDMQGQIPKARVDIIKTYLPYKKMHPKLSKWLKASMQNGVIENGKFLLRGDPRSFPFKDKPGTFELVADINQGVLNYREGWPIVHEVSADLVIKNKSLEVKGYDGTILNSSVDYVTAKIDDLKLPRLIIEGKANGPANDILDFLQQSALLKASSQIPKHITVDGNTTLDLDLVLTLTKKLQKERLVSGMVEFNNTNLTVTSASLPFTALNGKLYFNNSGAEGRGLKAKLFGSDFLANAHRTSEGRTVLSVNGNFDFSSYLSLNYQHFDKYIIGASPVTASINLPKFSKHNSDKSLEINIDSTLQGVHTSLPKPFYKEVNENKHLSIYTKYESNYDFPVFASYNDNAFLKAEFDNEKNKISALEFRMGDDQFQLPDQGVKISGKFDELDVLDWQKIFKSSTDKSSTIGVSEVDIQANSISWSAFEFRDVNFILNKGSKYWFGEIQSSVASGDFQYPLQPGSLETAIGTFEYLRLNKPESKDNIVIDPRDIPALHVQSKLLEFGNYAFNNVVLKTNKSPSGMMIDSLVGKAQDLQIFANGQWLVEENDNQLTDLKIQLITQNIKNSLTALGFETGISKGEGSVNAIFKWSGSPYNFSLKSFSGSANLRLKEGEISSVEPGAGRLVGLFNLGEISRRLSLDFTDFFSKGYVFDKIRGDLLFKDANLTTDNLKIKGPSADILIQGRTGIVAQDYDQTITVTPHVSGGLPWIGLAVGGPLGAVGVIVGEKVAKTIGIDVDKVTEVKYAMTGSWKDPKIEPIAEEVVKASQTPTTQGQPSPQQQPTN